MADDDNGTKATPEQQTHPVAPVTSLALPCTALDLYNWVKDVQCQRSGGHRQSTISATGSLISAS